MSPAKQRKMELAGGRRHEELQSRWEGQRPQGWLAACRNYQLQTQRSFLREARSVRNPPAIWAAQASTSHGRRRDAHTRLKCRARRRSYCAPPQCCRAAACRELQPIAKRSAAYALASTFSCAGHQPPPPLPPLQASGGRRRWASVYGPLPGRCRSAASGRASAARLAGCGSLPRVGGMPPADWGQRGPHRSHPAHAGSHPIHARQAAKAGAARGPVAPRAAPSVCPICVCPE